MVLVVTSKREKEWREREGEGGRGRKGRREAGRQEGKRKRGHESLNFECCRLICTSDSDLGPWSLRHQVEIAFYRTG